jgi:DNA-directed RNA polymerase subunit RPC12/RpoP
MSDMLDDHERLSREYLRDGISAVKTGELKLAQSLLNRAILMNGSDAQAYLWLAATTEDPKEQLEYLERAVSLDPANTAARRGLALLKGKIDPTKLVPEGVERDIATAQGPVEAQSEAFQCPRCGGRMIFSSLSLQLSCEYCGYQEEEGPAISETGAPGSVADRAEQVLDFVTPTTAGHHWSQAQQQLSCGRCGALSLLPPGHKTAQCPYCGSNQLVESPDQGDLVEPQVIALMQIDAKQADRLARGWLGKGLFAPDSLPGAARTLQLRPGYYSFWTFDGILEVKWSCEVAEETLNQKRWTPVSGAETRFFNDVLVPGMKTISLPEATALQPFDLQNVVAFKPEYLAGWPAVLYDCSLTDASLKGREAIFKQLRPQITQMIEVGREKRNLNLGGHSWSGMTFKHILLPLWAGTYRFQGQDYRLMINGQTGKISGNKPRDTLKLALLITILVFMLALILSIYWIATNLNLAF